MADGSVAGRMVDGDVVRDNGASGGGVAGYSSVVGAVDAGCVSV